MQTLHDTPHSAYLLHNNGIHELIYKDASRAAVEEVFGYERELLGNATRDQKVLQIIRFEAGLPPIRLIFQHMKEPSGGTATRSLPRLRIVLLYKESAIVTLLHTLAQGLRVLGIQIKHFSLHERENAVKWLLES